MSTEQRTEWSVTFGFNDASRLSLNEGCVGVDEALAVSRYNIHTGLGTEPKMFRRTVTVTYGEWEEVSP